MHSLNSPTSVIASAFYHAIHAQVFDPIARQSWDYEKVSKWREKQRRNGTYDPSAEIPEEFHVINHIPQTDYDLYVHLMFPQTWGSTALGFGGMGGAAITSAYTIIISSNLSPNRYAVYFNGRYAYTLDNPNDNFFNDIKRSVIAAVVDKGRYEA